MKNIKKEVLINKYNKLKLIKNLIKINILEYFIQNNNFTIKNKTLYKFLSYSMLINCKKKNLCLITSRKWGVNRNTNLSRLSFRRLARLGKIDNFKIN